MCHNSSILLLILTVLSLPSYGAEKAFISCEGQTASSGEVPAYTSPGSAWVVENLKCGQEVSVVRFEQGYARVQFGDKIGYVSQGFLRKAESQQELGARVDRLEEEVRTLQSQGTMESARGRQVPTGATEPGRQSRPIPRSTLDFPRFEAYGGYSFFWSEGAEKLHGIGASGTVNINRFFGVEANFSWEHTGETIYDPYLDISDSVGLNLYSFLGGPRVAFRTPAVTPFVHALFGVSRVTASESVMGIGVGVSLNGFTMGFGGGVDVNVSRHLAIRVIQVEYLPARFFGEFVHNYRAGAGIVAKF